MSSVICKVCVIKLRNKDNGKETKLPNIDYSKFKVPIITRSATECPCSWCKVGRYNGIEYVAYEKSVKNIDKKNKKSDNIAVKICSLCNGRIGKGIPHPCKKKNELNNLVSIVESSDQSGKVCSKLLNNMRNDQEIKKSGDVLTLPSGSKNLKINFGDKPKEMPQWSAEEALAVQNKLNMSDNMRDKWLTEERVKHGKGSVEPNIRETLKEKKRDMMDYFEVKM